MKQFDFSLPDANGDVPNREWLDKTFRHSGNGFLYRVTGFAWLGASDEWAFEMRRICGGWNVPVIRPLSHLYGVRSNGEQRYVVEEFKDSPHA